MKWMHKWNTTSHGRMLLWMVLVGNLNGGMAVYGVGLLDSPPNGMPSKDVGLHAVYGARIHVSPEEVLTNSWVLVRRDRIEKILKPDEKVPAGYREWKLGEPEIYAGFIEPYLEIDVPTSNTSSPGIHWNERVQPDRQVLSGVLPDEKMREELRKLGFGAAQLVPRNGLVRGFSSVISLAGLSEDRSIARPPILGAIQRQVMAFEGGRNPNSLMGQMALMRQVFLDAEWNARQGDMMGPNALDHLHIERSHPRNSGIPATAFLFKVLDEVDHLRADNILKEFGIRNVVMVGTGSEFKRVRALPTDYPIIVPLKFPKAPSIASVGEQESVELRQLMEWEYAPSNAKSLLDHGHRVALSTFGGVGEYAANLKKVMESGVSPEQGLSMVTTIPASLLGLETELGKIQAGYRANLVLSDKSLFVSGKVGEIQMSWVDGIPYRVAVDKPQDLKGTWLIQGDFGFEGPVELQITGSKGATLRINETQAEVSHFSMNAGALHFVSRHPAFGDEPLVIFSGSLLDPERGEASRMVGRTVHLDGSGIDWVADFQPKSSAVGQDESPGKEGIKASGSSQSWSGYWDGRVSESGGQKDISMTLYQRSDGQIYGHLEGDGKTVPMMAVTTTPQSLTAQFEPDRKYIKIYLRPGEQNSLSGWVTSGDSSAQWALKGSLLGRVGSPKPAASSPKLVGRWQLDVRLPDGGTAYPVIDLNYESGDWSGTLLLEGRPLEIIQIWSIGPSAEDDDGIFLLAEEANEQPHSDASPSRQTARLQLEVSDQGRVAQGSVTWADKSAHITLSKGLSAEAIESKKSVTSQSQPGPSESKPFISPLAVPFGPYGMESLPAMESVWVQGATIWTSGPLGKLESADMMTHEGQIFFVGTHEQALQTAESMPGVPWRIMDGAGKHVTPGLIDCHSHTGISRGINEVGQAVTAEVRIGDSTDPDDVNWYRQLAGGLTTVNTLHGSANPIGGQNQVNKIRWGSLHPDDMHFAGAIPGIKFALGENVKRSQNRYPNTRMGVESLFRERFSAALEYRRQWEQFQIGSTPMLPRRDLELEALSEILDGRRLIHCHSYRQDEILMLCGIAREYGFRIGTFQHILEGYKVAEAIREHAIGGSAFSDWWAYKVEVQDAIPYAGAIMHKAGVLVSFNSDDSEMARRMNLEAAKAVKYGNLSEMEALNFVTINPARQLMIDASVGSLEKGKDADFVLWSTHPFSTATVCQSTWIDGREYFSIEKDRDHRTKIAAERKRLMARVFGPAKTDSSKESSDKEENSQGAPKQSGDDISSPFEYWENRIVFQRNLQMYRLGMDPTRSSCGECGVRGHQLINPISEPVQP